MIRGQHLWMRLGDNGEYEEQDSPYGAGDTVSGYLSSKPDWEDVSWSDMGVHIKPSFTGQNYISLFWGDEDAQPAESASLNRNEKSEFNRGLGLRVASWSAPKKTAPKKRVGRSTRTTLGGMR